MLGTRFTVLLLAAACGATQTSDGAGAPATSSATPANPSVAPTSATTEPSVAPTSSKPTAAPADSPRSKMTALIAKALRVPNMEAAWYARVAASGLTDPGDYKLNVEWNKSFAGIVSSRTDESQCEIILAAAIKEPAVRPAAEKRCEELDALEKQVKAAKTPAAGLDAVLKACKIEGVQPTDKVTAFAALAAALVEDELGSQPESTPEEKGFARRIRGLCTMAP